MHASEKKEKIESRYDGEALFSFSPKSRVRFVCVHVSVLCACVRGSSRYWWKGGSGGSTHRKPRIYRRPWWAPPGPWGKGSNLKSRCGIGAGRGVMIRSPWLRPRQMARRRDPRPTTPPFPLGGRVPATLFCSTLLASLGSGVWPARRGLIILRAREIVKNARRCHCRQTSRIFLYCIQCTRRIYIVNIISILMLRNIKYFQQ